MTPADVNNDDKTGLVVVTERQVLLYESPDWIKHLILDGVTAPTLSHRIVQAMHAPPIKTVIFDCDGTLVDSETITSEVLVEFIGEFGLAMERDESLSLFVGRDMAEIVQELQGRLGDRLPDDFTDQFRVRQASALEERLLPIDGADDLLQSMNVPISLASNAPHEKIEINLRVTGLNRHFRHDRVFSAYDINAWKPQPDLFLHVADQTGFEPMHCAVVEDSAAGVEAALLAGMQVFCYVPTGELELTSEMANHDDRICFVSRLAELTQLLTV